MKIHHLRSATFIIESKEHYILVDPMLGAKGSLPPFSLFRFNAVRNPTVQLPKNSDQLLEKVTHCLLTHSQTFGLRLFQHTDHLDKSGEQFLITHNIPVFTPSKDKAYLQKYGMNVSHGLDHWQTIDFLGGHLTAIPAQHGHGWITRLMANGCGFYLELPNEPSLYMSGDTVLTDDVRKVLHDFKPDITIVAAGEAQMDVGQPILMPANEVVEFIKLSPNIVIANHLEALNHCPVERKALKQALFNLDILNKVYIPEDGETIHF